MESHIVTRLASISVDTCAACVVMNARAIAMATQNALTCESWIPTSAIEYANMLTRVIRLRMTLESNGRNPSLVQVLSALEDDGIAIYMNFLTTDAEKQALSKVRDSLLIFIPNPSPDPATAVFERVREMRSVKVGSTPWMHW